MTLKEEIISLYSAGFSYNQIKEQLNCSKGTIAYHLGAGQKEKTVGRTRDKRSQIRKYIQEAKQATPCTDCGENYPYWIMEFDHLGDKSFNISSYKKHTLSFDKVKEEISKCEIVCSNCHKNRTYMRVLMHGESSMEVDSFYE